MEGKNIMPKDNEEISVESSGSELGSSISSSDSARREVSADPENYRVLCSKLLVITALLLSAAAVTAAVFLFTKHEEEEDFETAVSRYLETCFERKKPSKRLFLTIQLPPPVFSSKRLPRR
jgi:hypothetical protein